MKTFITIPEGIRLNVNCIESYAPHPADAGKTTIFLTSGEQMTIQLPAEDLDRLTQSAESILSGKDSDLLHRLCTRLEDLKNAIGRIPSSVRMHF